MDKDSCFQLGYIAKVHGLHGEVVAVLDVDYPEDYENIEHVFVAQNSRLVPYFLEHFVLQPNNKALAKFEGFDSVDGQQDWWARNCTYLLRICRSLAMTSTIFMN